MNLKEYHQKRNFTKTSEPKGKVFHGQKNRFYVQKHAASHLHYDFRLELNGVLKSWAIPKGPSYDPTIKRLAIHVEDHPIEYGKFQGIIPKGQYGGGTVMLWDRGRWEHLDGDPLDAYKHGHLRLILKAKKLKGRWDLIRFKKEEDAWFLIKFKDNYSSVRSKDITEEEPNSVLTNQSIEEISRECNSNLILDSNKKPSKNNQKSMSENKKFEKARKNENKEKIRIKINALDLPKSSLPKITSPELASLVQLPPEGDQWLHEIKFDGYRILAFKNKNTVKLITRNNKDWSDKFPAIVKSIQKIPIDQLILDGEIALLDKQGRTSFQLLQNALKNGKNYPFVYYLFDLLYYDQWNTMDLPLIERKKLLFSFLHKSFEGLYFSNHIRGEGKKLYQHACKLSLEGIVSKQIYSIYQMRRTKSWLKIKCHHRQELVVGGFTLPQRSRKHFGALLVGFYNEKGMFVYSGKVGTGFNEYSLNEVYSVLKKTIIQSSPFVEDPKEKNVQWVKPKLVVEIEFTEWTEDGRLRHPSFKGIREDKNPQEVSKERKKVISPRKEKKLTTIKDNKKRLKKEEEIGKKVEVDTEKKNYRGKKEEKKSQIASRRANKCAVKLTSPTKLLYPEDKIHKEELFAYYDFVAPYILPHLINRPLTLVRCPQNYKSCFFQKKLKDHAYQSLYPLKVSNNSNEEPYLYIRDKNGLLSLIQLDALEIHPWGSLISNLEKPDRIIIDLDPGPGISWNKIVEAAFDVKEKLEQLQLKSFVKTTGGKGLHVVIPIEPQYNWDEVKYFTLIFVQLLEKINPEKYISTISKVKREGKIFVDYLRNQYGATAIAPFSTRARLHAPVSTPLAWEELSSRKIDNTYTIQNLPKRLKQLIEDPWKEFWNTYQKLKLDKFKA